MNTSTGYKPINAFYDTVSASTIYHNPVITYWDSEVIRRNAETAATDSIGNHSDDVVEKYKLDLFDEETTETLINTMTFSGPNGEFPQGSSQSLSLRNQSRLFNGNYNTYGKLMNERASGSLSDWIIPPVEYYRQGQIWYFTFGLPSSAKFIPATKDAKECKAYSSTLADTITNGHYLIVATADFISTGTVWSLRYSMPAQEFTLTHNGVEVTIPRIPPSVVPVAPSAIVTVYDPSVTSANDYKVQGTH